MKSQPPDDKTEALSEESLTRSQRTTLNAIPQLYNLTTENASQRQASLSAFEALFLLRGFWTFDAPPGEYPDAEHSAHYMIQVPWWIVDILGRGWCRYMDAPERSTFGEALGLEGGGQGKQPAKREWAKDLRDLSLAIAVAEFRNQYFQRGKRLSLEKAYGQVATKAQSSEDIVRLAWRKHGPMVKASLEASVPSMTGDSQILDDVRVSGDDNSGMHMAVS